MFWNALLAASKDNFFTKEIALGTNLTAKYWELIVAVVVLALLSAAVIVCAVLAGKKGKRTPEQTGEERQEAIDVSAPATQENANPHADRQATEEEILSANTESPADYVHVDVQKEETEQPEAQEPAAAEEETTEEAIAADERAARELAAEEPTEEPAEEPVEEVTEEPVEEVVEEPAEEIVEEPAEEIAEEPAEETSAEETVAAVEEEPVAEEAPAEEVVNTETPAAVADEPKAEEPKEEPKQETTKKAKREEEMKEEKKAVKKEEPKKAEPKKAEAKKAEPAPKKEEPKKGEVLGKIEICNSNLGGFNYLLRANNGQLLFESKAYKSMASCKEAIANFIEAVKAGMFSVRADKFKNYKFVLKSPTSNNLIYVGESFSTRSSCENNIESVKRFAVNSKIVDITEKDFVAVFVKYEIPAEIVKAVEKKEGTPGKWVIDRVDESKNAPFEFLLYANNGQLLFESRDYKSYATCLGGLTTFVNTVRTGVFAIDPDKSGRFKFVLRSSVSNAVVEYYGQNYDTRKGCASSIESVYRFALLSPVPEK